MYDWWKMGGVDEVGGDSSSSGAAAVGEVGTGVDEEC